MKIIKLIGTLLLLCILNTNIYSQTTCASGLNLSLIQQNNPSRYQQILALEQFTQDYITSVNNGNNTARLITPNSTIIIPVVVHVLHRGEAVGVGRNISDAQIQSQIAVLNEDYRRLNADRVNTPAAFQPVAVDPNFEFRLACTDPNGTPTNGITRTLTNLNQFFPLNNLNANGSINEVATGIKYTVGGGRDAWPTARYLNIWVCDMGGGLIGYGQFPFDYSTKPNTDGVVMLFNAFGRVGNLLPGLNQGRVCVHEIGHWLNLRHIWGDANCGDDLVGDTPPQSSPNRGCPAFPRISCNNGPNGDMFMNYMDYTDNNCMNVYTRGQSLRMRAIFATANGIAGPRAAFINNFFSVNQPASSICNTGTVTATNINCLPITWTVLSGPATIIGGQGTNTVTLQRTTNGNGVAVIRASTTNYFDEKSVNMGTVISDPLFEQKSVLCSGGGNQYSIAARVTDIPGATSYSWYINGVLKITTNVNSATVPGGTANGSINTLQARIQTPCGQVLTALPEGRFSATCGSGMIFLGASPNPASESINLTIFEQTDFSKSENENQTIAKTGIVKSDRKTIISLLEFNSGLPVRQWIQNEIKSKTYRFNIAGVRKGIYVLQVDRDNKSATIKIIVN